MTKVSNVTSRIFKQMVNIADAHTRRVGKNTFGVIDTSGISDKQLLKNYQDLNKEIRQEGQFIKSNYLPGLIERSADSHY